MSGSPDIPRNAETAAPGRPAPVPPGAEAPPAARAGAVPPLPPAPPTAGPSPSPAPSAASPAGAGAAPSPSSAGQGPSAPPPLLLSRALAYMFASITIALGSGLGQGFISVNLAQIAGDLGVTTAQASWLTIAYIVPRCVLPIMLIKIRTQYGLRRFAEVAITAYALFAFAAVWMSDLRSAVVVELLSGSASAALSTLAFLYMLEPLAPQWKMRLGLPMVMSFMVMGPSLARVVSPALIGDGGLTRIHLLSLGLALVSLALVFRLPLRPVPHMKVIQPMDLASFVLIAFGFTAVIICFVMGPIYWWTEARWLGPLLAGGVVALALAGVIELHRAQPLLDVRWLASPAMLHLTGTLLIFRIILSEQSTGAPRMFQVLGVGPDQMVALFAVICMAGLMGGLACVAFIKPGREPQFHFVALLLIAAGAWMDASSTLDTRPEQMLISQAMIAFAGMLFMPPAMMAGLLSAMAKGQQYILSFIIVYISTQSIGGILGSGVFTTLINHRQAFHYQVLIERLTTTAAPVTQELAQRMAALTPQIGDPALRRAQAMAQIAAKASDQAYVMAYNDVYFVTFLIATAAAALLCLHVLRDWIMAWRARPLTPPSPQ